MARKGVFQGEPGPAFPALERPFATVNASVFHESSLRGKTLVTHFALERFFAGVCALVNLHMSFVTESCVTFLAAKGLLAGMCPLMSLKSTFLREAFPALCTLVRLLFAVRQSVLVEALLPFKALYTQVATKGCNVTMNPPVTDQGGP